MRRHDFDNARRSDSVSDVNEAEPRSYALRGRAVVTSEEEHFIQHPGNAIRKVGAKLDEAETRRTLHRDAVRARDYLRGMGTGRSLARSGELNFLIKAIEKRGLR